MTLGEKVQYWGAIVIGFGAGVAGIVAAVVYKQVAYAIWGGFFILGTAIVLWCGAKASVSGKLEPPTLEAWFKRIKDGPIYILLVLMIAAIVLTIVFRPF